LLKNGRVALKGLHSEKTGKKYDATIILDDTGDGYVNFKMEFGKYYKTQEGCTQNTPLAPFCYSLIMLFQQVFAVR